MWFISHWAYKTTLPKSLERWRVPNSPGRSVVIKNPTPANLLQPVMPPACLRTAQMVETAPRRTARTRHRLRQGPRCHTAGPAWSWHQPPAAARAEATPSTFAPCREVRTVRLGLWLGSTPAPTNHPCVRCLRLAVLAISRSGHRFHILMAVRRVPPDLGRTKLCRAAIWRSWG